MKLGIYLMLGKKFDRIEYKGRKVPTNQLNKYADHEITIEQYEDEDGYDADDNPIIRQLTIVKINEKL